MAWGYTFSSAELSDSYRIRAPFFFPAELVFVAVVGAPEDGLKWTEISAIASLMGGFLSQTVVASWLEY